MKKILSVLLLLVSLQLGALERQSVWPKGKMPDAQGHQIAAMTDVSHAEVDEDAKNAISHRGAALRKMLQSLL